MVTVPSPTMTEALPAHAGPRPGSHRSVTPQQVSDEALSPHPLSHLRAVTFPVCFSTASSLTLETTVTVSLPWFLPLRSPARTVANHPPGTSPSPSARLQAHWISPPSCFAILPPNNRLRACHAYFYALIFLTPPIPQLPECSFGRHG